MCGIVYVRRHDGKPARKQVLKRYGKQEDRGSEGFGYVSIGDQNEVLGYKRYQTEREVRQALEKSSSPHVLFHHRFPTSTINIPESAHPIRVKHKELKYTYYVVHNGVLSNSRELFYAHGKLGYKYSTLIQPLYRSAKGKEFLGDATFNDSESLAIELARTIEGLQPSVKATGTIAYLVLQVRDKKACALYYGTNGGNPLTIEKTATGTCIASEGGRAIPENKGFRLDFATDEITETHVKLIPYAPYKPAIGYSTYNYDYRGNYAKTKTSAELSTLANEDAEEEDYSPDYGGTDETREEIAQIVEYLADIENDLNLAYEVGEPEDIEELEIQKQALQQELIELRMRKFHAG